MNAELVITEEFVTVGYCTECFDPDWDGGWSGYESFYGTEDEIRQLFEDHVEEFHYE